MREWKENIEEREMKKYERKEKQSKMGYGEVGKEIGTH